MTVPGFPAEALSETGGPRWIDELSVADPDHLLHVVRGLVPARAIELVGGKVLRSLAPGELPAERPQDWSTTVHGALGLDEEVELLTAGQRGEWTFVHDASGVTGLTTGQRSMVGPLSADGRVAAIRFSSIDGDANFDYAEDEQLLVSPGGLHDHEDLEELREALGKMPEAVARVVEAAGFVDSDRGDTGLGMRWACLLAGLTWTPEEFRAQPLVVGEVVTSVVNDMPAAEEE